MTLRSRLALGLVTIAIILVIPLLMAVQSLDRLYGEARGLQRQEFAASLLLGRLREGLFDLRQMEIRLLFVHDSASRNAIASKIDEVRLLTDSLEHYRLSDAASNVRKAVDSLHHAEEAVRNTRRR